jgi:hypothetical protein
MEAIVGLSVSMIFFGIYFLPAIIAGNREHNNFWPILVLNFLLGYTFIGWVFALIWSMTDNVKE